MSEFINGWVQGIIVAVIISSIIEMVIPNGSMKKYIKTIVGIFILFAIVTPVINKIKVYSVDNAIKVDKIIEDLSEGETIVDKTIENNKSKTIKDVYIENLKEDICLKLSNRGYEIGNINIIAADDENFTLECIKINVIGKVLEEKIQIDDIVLSKNEKLIDSDSIKNFISDEYKIDKKKVFIY